MTRRPYVRRLFQRLISFLPSGPHEGLSSTSVPDPNEPGISAKTRQARLSLILQRYQKDGRGSGR